MKKIGEVIEELDRRIDEDRARIAMCELDGTAQSAEAFAIRGALSLMVELHHWIMEKEH